MPFVSVVPERTPHRSPHRSPRTEPKNKSDPPKIEWIALFLSVPTPTKSAKSGKLIVVGKSKVAKVAKVAKVGIKKSPIVGKVAKVGEHQSRKLLKSSPKSCSRVAAVRKLLDSRRVGKVSLSDIVCIIVGVVMHVRSNHIFRLILIAEVVFTEENT